MIDDLQGILTELVKDCVNLNHDIGRVANNMSMLPSDKIDRVGEIKERVRGAIKTAAEQIRQQQWARTEEWPGLQ